MNGAAPLLALAALLAPPTIVRPETWPLTPDGYGPVRIGMTRADVGIALGSPLEGEPLDDETLCIELQAARGYEGLTFMFRDGRLARISVGAPSRVVTPRGIGVGADADQVRRAYGRGLTRQAHFYEGLPSEYLTFWVRPRLRGIRFETDSGRRVTVIHAGNRAIELAEGCA